MKEKGSGVSDQSLFNAKCNDKMESKEVCERYITLCFVEGLDAFDGVTNLEYKKNLLSNEFVAKLNLTYEVMKNEDKVVDRKLLASLKGELYFIDFIVNLEEDDVEPYADKLDVLLASINIDPISCLFVCNMGKGLRNKKKPTKTYKMTYEGERPSVTINRPKTQEELTREVLEEDLYERIMLLNEKRSIIKTLKYEKFDFHALVDTGSNKNMTSYRIYELFDREKVKPRIDKNMITYGMFQRMIGYDNIQRNGLLLLSMFEDRHRERSLDATTLKEVIIPDERLIAEDPAPGCVLERMSRWQSYHSNRYASVFEHMAGHYGVHLDADYIPPGYDKQR
nr:hypothetical protein [Tanacetum cinerariifolium]